jgi:peptidoglycan/LPS O-acetylase OafA/YrhL
MPETPRRPDLQGARGVAVSAVVGYHALRLVLERQGGDWGDVSPLWWWAATGRLGVDAFFVLAGYLVVASWNSCRALASSRPAAVAEFARRRSWRILPPYLAMLAVVVPLVAPDVLAGDRAWVDVGRLLTLQQYFDPDLTAHVNVPIWSLTTEAHFYLVAPLLAWLLARLGGWRVVLPAAALALWWAQTDLRGDLSAGLLPGRIDQFVVGAAAGALIVSWQQGQRSRIVDALTAKGALSTLLVALLAVGTYHGATWRSGDDGILPLLVHPMAGWLLAGVLVRLTCGSTPRLLVHPALTSLGGVSFSLYLWHYPILRRGLALVHPTQPTGLVALVTVVLVAAGVAVAALAHALVERPATRHEQERRARSRARTDPVTVTHRGG